MRGDDVYGTVTSLGHNLIGDTTDSTGFGADGDLLNVDAKLAPLANNGGSTQTCALLPGSAALGAADAASVPATDQRGITRPQGAAADIGAFEVVPIVTSLTCSGYGVYGEAASLVADLTTGEGVAISSMTVVFSLNGVKVGTAITDADGVAILRNVDITGYHANNYNNYMAAVFAGNESYCASSTTGWLTVAPAELFITADNKAKLVGKAVPKLTYTTSGLVGSDAMLTTPTLSTTATVDSPTGDYPITVAGGSASSDYTILYKAGTLSVTPIPVIKGATPSLTGGTLAANQTTLSVRYNVAVVGAADATNYELRGVGADGLLGTADDAILPVSVAYSGAKATLTFAAIAEGVYRLTVHDAVTDAYANAIDGDNDGVCGGDWVSDFVVIPENCEMALATTFRSGGNVPLGNGKWRLQ